MITSIKYLPSNAVGTSNASVDSGSQASLVSSQLREGGAVAQLSAFGQVKSSLVDLQNKASALKNFSKPPTLEDFKVVVQGFVQSLNSINKGVKESMSKQGASSTDSRFGQALNDLRKAANGDSANVSTSLQNLSISQQEDGAFIVDQKQLKKSFQDNRSDVLSAASDIANRVTLVASQQLSGNGVIGKMVVPAVQSTNTGGNAAAAYSSVASL